MGSVITPVVWENTLYLGYGPEDALPKKLGLPIDMVDPCAGIGLWIGKNIFTVSRESLRNHLKSIRLLNVVDTSKENNISYGWLIEKNISRVNFSFNNMADALPAALRKQKTQDLLKGLIHDSPKRIKTLVREGAYFDFQYVEALYSERDPANEAEFIHYIHDTSDCQTYRVSTPLARCVQRGKQELARYFYALKKDISNDAIIEKRGFKNFRDDGQYDWISRIVSVDKVCVEKVDETGRAHFSLQKVLS